MANCNDCVKGDFGTIKRLVFLMLGLMLASNAYIVFASQDSVQNNEIAILKQKDIHRTEQDKKTNETLEKLVTLTTEININLLTHIAEGKGK